MSTIALAMMLVTGGAPDQNGYAIAASHPGIVTHAACDCGRRCYPRLPGSHDHVRRLPAYHGTYYRRPTDYRNQHDYPWHTRICPPRYPHAYSIPFDNEEIGDEESPPLPPEQPATEAVDSDRGVTSGVIQTSATRIGTPRASRRARPLPVSAFERAMKNFHK